MPVINSPFTRRASEGGGECGGASEFGYKVGRRQGKTSSGEWDPLPNRFPQTPIHLSLRRISNVLMYCDGAGVGGMDEEQGSRHWNKCVDRTNHLRETTRILAFENRELYSFEGMGYCPGEGQPAVAESAQGWVLRTCILVQDLPRAQLQNAGYTRKALCLSFKQFHLYPLIL